MNRRTLMVLVPCLAVVTAAFAYGGWAVITLDEVPTHLTIGKPTTITFKVRQHGIELMNDLKPTIEAKLGSLIGGSTVNIAATRTSLPGQYTASLSVPRSGEWRLTVNSGWGNSRIKLMPLQALDAGKTVAALSQAERGKHLYAAKGCTTCHVNKEVEGGLQTDVGPDLTGKAYEPAFLAMWLENPKIKPPTKAGNEMPDLGLSKVEIASIVAFINNGKTAAAKQH